MDLLEFALVLRNSFLEASIEYLIGEAVVAGKRALKNAGLLQGRSLYLTWHNCVKTALNQFIEAGNLNLDDISVNKLVEDIESFLKNLDFFPLRISSDFIPKWLEEGFFQALSKQKRIPRRVANNLLACVILVAEKRLEKIIGEKEEIFRKAIHLELTDVRKAISLLTPAIPIAYEECNYIENVFVPPKSIAAIENMLRERNVAFIVGPPHIGKTFVAKSILLRHAYQGYEALTVTSKCDRFFLKKLLKGSDRCILLIDDFYGKYTFDKTSGRFLQSLGELLRGTDRHHKLLLTTRADILNQAHRAGYHEDIPVTEFLVEIATNDYPVQSRLMILRKLVKNRNIKKSTRKAVRGLERFIVRRLQFPHNISWLVEHHLQKGTCSRREIIEMTERSNLVETEISNLYNGCHINEKMLLGVLSLLEVAHLETNFDQILSFMERIGQDPFSALDKHKTRPMLHRFVQSRVLRRDLPEDFGDLEKYHFYHPSYLEAVLNAFVSDYDSGPYLENLLVDVSNKEPSHLGMDGILGAVVENANKSRADLFEIVLNLSQKPNPSVRLSCIRTVLKYWTKAPMLFSDWLAGFLNGASRHEKIAIARNYFVNLTRSSELSDILLILSLDDDKEVRLMLAFCIHAVLNVERRIVSESFWERVQETFAMEGRGLQEAWAALEERRWDIFDTFSWLPAVARELERQERKSRKTTPKQTQLSKQKESLQKSQREEKALKEFNKKMEAWDAFFEGLLASLEEEAQLAAIEEPEVKTIENSAKPIICEDVLKVLEKPIKSLLSDKNRQIRQLMGDSILSCHRKLPEIRDCIETMFSLRIVERACSSVYLV